MEHFDVLLVDLQDLGCRIYTFITTLRYLLEAAAVHNKKVIVLDRPNPAGRPVEGLILRPGWESFVGAGPMPMRHGLTMGEMGHWFIRSLKLDVEYEVITMHGDDYEEGTLVLSCHDVSEGTLIFQGQKVKVIQENPSKREKTIPKAVSKLMRKFPIEKSK